MKNKPVVSKLTMSKKRLFKLSLFWSVTVHSAPRCVRKTMEHLCRNESNPGVQREHVSSETFVLQSYLSILLHFGQSIQLRKKQRWCPRSGWCPCLKIASRPFGNRIDWIQQTYDCRFYGAFFMLLPGQKRKKRQDGQRGYLEMQSGRQVHWRHVIHTYRDVRVHTYLRLLRLKRVKNGRIVSLRLHWKRLITKARTWKLWNVTMLPSNVNIVKGGGDLLKIWP